MGARSDTRAVHALEHPCDVGEARRRGSPSKIISQRVHRLFIWAANGVKMSASVKRPAAGACWPFALGSKHIGQPVSKSSSSARTSAAEEAPDSCATAWADSIGRLDRSGRSTRSTAWPRGRSTELPHSKSGDQVATSSYTARKASAPCARHNGPEY